MTPLEAATRLSGSGWDLVGRCPWCGRLRGSPDLNLKGHKPDCPYLSMPRIVAALEAAERLQFLHLYSMGVSAEELLEEAEPLIQALAAALRGEGELG